MFLNKILNIIIDSFELGLKVLSLLLELFPEDGKLELKLLHEFSMEVLFDCLEFFLILILFLFDFRTVFFDEFDHRMLKCLFRFILLMLRLVRLRHFVLNYC